MLIAWGRGNMLYMRGYQNTPDNTPPFKKDMDNITKIFKNF